PGIDGSYPQYLTNVNGTLFFAAYGDLGNVGLWKSDGTPAGTVQVHGSGASQPSLSPSDLTEVKGRLMFVGTDSAGRRGIWTSDGRGAGTGPIAAINSTFDGSASQLTNASGNLFFAVDSSNGDRQLWRSDGTTAGTILLKTFDVPLPSVCWRSICYYPP